MKAEGLPEQKRHPVGEEVGRGDWMVVSGVIRSTAGTVQRGTDANRLQRAAAKDGNLSDLAFRRGFVPEQYACSYPPLCNGVPTDATRRGERRQPV
jgi:hypothetical protein